MVNVSLNLLLIRTYGGVGAAIATSAAVLLGAVWIVWKVLDYMRSVPETHLDDRLSHPHV